MIYNVKDWIHDALRKHGRSTDCKCGFIRGNIHWGQSVIAALSLLPSPVISVVLKSTLQYIWESWIDDQLSRNTASKEWNLNTSLLYAPL